MSKDREDMVDHHSPVGVPGGEFQHGLQTGQPSLVDEFGEGHPGGEDVMPPVHLGDDGRPDRLRFCSGCVPAMPFLSAATIWVSADVHYDIPIH